MNGLKSLRRGNSGGRISDTYSCEYDPTAACGLAVKSLRKFLSFSPLRAEKINRCRHFPESLRWWSFQHSRQFWQ